LGKSDGCGRHSEKHLIKAILFDLDGVLVDTKELHYELLNLAILEVTNDRKFVITPEEHLSTYDGLKTTEKLNLLTKLKKLPEVFHKSIWEKKQGLTIDVLEGLKENNRLKDMLVHLKDKNYRLAVCSNSIRKTVNTVLSKLGIIQYFDIIISNEDVISGKPHPEMYWSALTEFQISPEEALIIEDSPPGLLAAHRSNSHVLRIKNSRDLTMEKIEKAIKKCNNCKNCKSLKWEDDTLNVLIPMAGRGYRFLEAGFNLPKPLIHVFDKPMIQTVVESLNIKANFIYIVQSEHRKLYNLDSVLGLITPNCRIVEVDSVTEGAACTTLLAKHFINNDSPLVIANSDQYIEWNSSEFFYKMNEQNLDAGILTFTATESKWSYAKVDDLGFVTEIAEKKVISDIATVGVYYWKHGSDYVKYAEQMIDKNIRVNNEFYVAPVFNEAIGDGKRIKTFGIQTMHGLGTPEDLKYFLENYEE